MTCEEMCCSAGSYGWSALRIQVYLKSLGWHCDKQWIWKTLSANGISLKAFRDGMTVQARDMWRYQRSLQRSVKVA